MKMMEEGGNMVMVAMRRCCPKEKKDTLAWHNAWLMVKGTHIALGPKLVSRNLVSRVGSVTVLLGDFGLMFSASGLSLLVL